MMFPKKTQKPKEISVEEYRKMVAENPKMIPKKSKLLPSKSKTMKSVCPESLLQKAANELITLKNWAFIRFDDWFLRYMRIIAPAHVGKHFFDQWGGKMPDNVILLELGEGFFLGCKLELKTEDSKGRAVGQLHGKQKHYANAEGWQIARNTRQVEEVLVKIEKIHAEIKEKIDFKNQ